jgi:hypothetical protein
MLSVPRGEVASLGGDGIKFLPNIIYIYAFHAVRASRASRNPEQMRERT